MKRQLTPDQIQARDARRATFKALWKQVSAMPEAERIAKCAKLGLVTCDGHALSLGNTMLIILQKSNATVLGGFRQWLKHGRCVKKGEHGAMIWVPIGGKKTENPDTGETTTDNGGDKPGFVIGTVFDISQTEETGQTAVSGNLVKEPELALVLA